MGSELDLEFHMHLVRTHTACLNSKTHPVSPTVFVGQPLTEGSGASLAAQVDDVPGAEVCKSRSYESKAASRKHPFYRLC